MNPTSPERIKWLIERLAVLDAVKKDLIRRHAWYSQAMQASQEVITHTVMTVRAETLQLQAELNVLQQWQADKEEK